MVSEYIRNVIHTLRPTSLSSSHDTFVCSVFYKAFEDLINTRRRAKRGKAETAVDSTFIGILALRS